MKKIFLLFTLLALAAMSACTGDRRTSPEVLQAKLDSVRKLEELRQLRLRGINLEQPSVNPAKVFFDSLEVQTLPFSYSEEFVKSLSNYQSIPMELQQLMGLGELDDPRAIALPRRGVKLMMVSASEGDDERSLWLYLLGSDWLPVDQLCLYKKTAPKAIKRVGETDIHTYFSVTSDMQICIEGYTDAYKRKTVKVYLPDNNGHFIEL